MEKDIRVPELPDDIFKTLFDLTILEPTMLFENVAFVGYKGVGSLVINTSEGIILIDAMWTYNDGRDVIVPGIKKLGWDPENIKSVLLTHGHTDHYGSARFFEDHFNANIYISEVDWKLMMDPNAPVLKDPFGNTSDQCLKPTRYLELTDRQKITLGNTTITAIHTPGHSPGGVSFIIPVEEEGTPHVIGIWGGTGLPRKLEDVELYLRSLDYFESVADEMGVDVEISIHPFVNHLLEKIEALQSRKHGDPNPLVIGKKAVKDYWNTSLRKEAISKIQALKEK